MGKYIWPRQLGEATIWYLEILSGKRKLSIDALIAEQIRDNTTFRHNRDKARRRIVYLVNTGLVKKSGRYQNAVYELTDKGLERLEQLSMQKLRARVDSWDRKWRLVLFDIPESARLARDQIRRLLKELGFQQLQLSVWVHPLPCLEYFKEIQRAYGIADHLFIVQSSEVNIPRSIVAHFQRQYPKLHIK
ncbi:CRISPR-associated endonuclease Cas2 [Candidatus Saccharibacteria bacterium]|nr:CRISPR-associated endonuclease Cas2 [Candidatus Saccharibacteria bacterium]